MHYYGTRLSENISRREPEGYLLCLNVPVARTGTQDYLPEELGLLPGSSFISVYRPEEEVFSPETVASFEGMPVTNDHPPEGVDIGNIRALQKGHAHNVRRGSGEDADLLLADLIITDPGLIRLILDEGKREISCGYTYELHEENGQYIQRKIRGNHVAVVDAGRAGPRVSIKDHKAKEPERSKFIMKKSLVKKLVRMAKDGDPEAIEAVAELLEEVAEGGTIEPAEAAAEEAVEEVAEAVAEAAEDPAAVVETPEGTTIVVDEATLGEVISRLDQIIALLTPAAGDEDPADPAEEIVEVVEEAVEAVLAEGEALTTASGGNLVRGEVSRNEQSPQWGAASIEAAVEAVTPEEIGEMVEEILDPVSEVLEENVDECGEEEQEVIASGDALRAALRAVAPALAKMPKKQRTRVCSDIAARLGDKPRRGADGVYTALASARRKPAEDPKALGRRIMASRSANRPKA